MPWRQRMHLLLKRLLLLRLLLRLSKHLLLKRLLL
jgi:hypothetical protein